MEIQHKNKQHQRLINQDQFQSFSQEQNDDELDKQHLEQSTQVYSAINQSVFYTTKKIEFPSPPQHFLELYQIYKSNTDLIKELKTQINKLKQIKHLNEKLEYDQNNFDIQECIDIDDQSQFYSNSKKTYQLRQSCIKKLNKQYNQINSQQLQTLMLNDQVSKEIIDQHLIKNKQIIDCKCYKKFFVVLSLQTRTKRRKLVDMGVFNYANLSTGKSTEKSSLQTPQKQQKSRSKIKAPSNITRDKKSNDKSQKSQDQGKTKQTHKYIIRCTYYNQLIPSIKSQGSHILPIVLPNHLNSQPTKISIDQTNNIFILLMKDNSIYYFQVNFQAAIVKSLYDMDVNIQPILLDSYQTIHFIQSRNGLLYVGNSDGILRVYELQMSKTQTLVGYKLINIYGVFLQAQNFNTITHYCFPENNQNQIFFVGDAIHLCSLNILTFRTQKIKSFEDKIIKIQPNIIKTTHNVYLNYCSANSHELCLMNIQKWRLRFDLQRENLFKQASQGKMGSAILKPEQKKKYLKMQEQERKKCQECQIIGLIKDNQKQISIFNQLNGYFSAFFIIESIEKHQM